MRASEIGCLLVLSGATFTLSCGGGSKGYVAKGSEQITTSVVINNCTATPDTAAVFLSTNLSFSSTDGNYQLAFKGSPPVPNGSFTITANPASQHVQRSLGCWLSWGNCYYAYTLKKSGSDCPDPGVHIIPGGP